MSSLDIPLIVNHLLNGESIKDIGHWFSTSTSTIYRIKRNWEQNGIYSTSRTALDSHSRHSPLQDIYVETFLLHKMREKPSTTLKEYQQYLLKYFQISLSLSSISKFFLKKSISYKKLNGLAFESNYRNICMFFEIIHAVVRDARQLVFIDESHRNAKTSNRNYGRFWKSMRAVEYKQFTRGSYSMSLLLAVDLFGPFSYEVFFGSVNANVFMNWLLTELLPLMNRYPSVIHSILILDNCPIHHTPMMQIFRYWSGSLIIYLPPYCPYLNLCEYVFNGIKMIEKRKEIHSKWSSYISLCESTEYLKNNNWISVLKRLKYV